VLVPALGYYWGINLSAIVSILFSALIGGYVFAGKIWEESRLEAIAKITVLAALLIAFDIGVSNAATDWSTWAKGAYREANPGAAEPSAFEWYAIESTLLGSQVFLNVVLVLVLGFVGLYVGSMFKRPTKT
jgi:hypothetical protein